MEDDYWKAEAFAEIAAAQASVDVEVARDLFAKAIHLARSIQSNYTNDENAIDKADALAIIAMEQAKAGFGAQAVKVAEEISIERDELLPTIADALVETNDRDNFKRLLIPCAYYLNAAYKMCGLLPRLYPQQTTAIAAVVMDEAEAAQRLVCVG